MKKLKHYEIYEYQNDAKEDCITVRHRLTGRVMYDGTLKRFDRILIFATERGEP